MRNVIYIVCLFFSSCQLNTNDNNQVYRLAIMPLASSPQLYDIVNETKLEMEVNGQEVNNINKSTIGLQYKINKDSTGNFIIDLAYDKIQLYTKNGQTETELDAENAPTSINAVEKMLGILKNAKLSAVITPKGETKEVKGYKEVGEKLMADFNPNDSYGQAMARKQWESTMRQQLIDNNLNQVIKIFPDSLVRVGEQWTIPTKQKDHFEFTVLSTYTLKKIEGDMATITVKGDMTIEDGSSNTIGPSVVADLSGTQSGEYKVNIRTGLPVESEIQSVIEGKMQTMGRTVPITIENRISLKKRN